jgi:hypothetical protein
MRAKTDGISSQCRLQALLDLLLRLWVDGPRRHKIKVHERPQQLQNVLLHDQPVADGQRRYHSDSLSGEDGGCAPCLKPS